MRLAEFLVARGWEYYQYAPVEGKWAQLDKSGKVIATEGDKLFVSHTTLWRKLRNDRKLEKMS